MLKNLRWLLPVVLMLAACATHETKPIGEPATNPPISWEQRAAAGDAEAMNRLGVDYEFGTDGVSKDPDKAAFWLSKAADAQHVDGMANLGYLYLNGIGVPKDLFQARRLFEKASSAGNLQATCNLGGMLVDGAGGPKDPVLGWPLVTKAADAGLRACQTTLGLAYRYGMIDGKRDRERAKKYLSLAAQQGEDLAKAVMAGFILDENPDDEAKTREAVELLLDLSDQGVTEADVVLSIACVGGTPWPPDGECARRHLQIAASHDFPKNGDALGLILESDFGGAPDLIAAEHWFRVAIAVDAAKAAVDLGRLLLHENRDEEALSLLVTASAQHPDDKVTYLLWRYCREHDHCPIEPVQRQKMAQYLATLPERQRNNLAWALAVDPLSDSRDGRYALALMAPLIKFSNRDWRHFDTYAAALARAGRFDEAVRWQTRAIAEIPAGLPSRETKRATALRERFAAHKTVDYD